MMHQSVAHAGFVDVARFGIIDFKSLISAVPVGFIFQIMMQRQNIIHEMQRKFSHIFALLFSTQKLSPRHKQIFDGYDIIVDMTKPFTLSLSLDKASIVQRTKEAYLIWMNISPHIQKGARYTIGARIENKLLDLLELVYIAYFSKKENKVDKISECIFLLDTLKFFVSVAWDAKLLSNRQFEEIALKLEEVGRMFWGWKNGLGNPQKKNRDL